MLCEFHGDKFPAEIREAELEIYFLHRRNVDHWSANTLRIDYCGIRFYFVKVFQRAWNLFNFLRAKSELPLPAVLRCEELRALLACADGWRVPKGCREPFAKAVAWSAAREAECVR